MTDLDANPEDTLTAAELRDLRRRVRQPGVEGEGTDGGWSQVQFARALGIASNTLARTERGELPIQPSFGRLVVYVFSELMNQSVAAVRADLVRRRAASKRSTNSERQRAATRRRSSTTRQK